MSMYVPQKERFKSMEEYLNKVRCEISLTLSARSEPFDDPKKLARQFAEDCGLNPQMAANDFGFPFFENFLHSKLMEKHVRIDVDAAGRTIYRAHVDQRSKHIVEDQAIAHAAIVEKDQKSEARKSARAMLPENRTCFIEGKRRFVDIVHYLGGEEKIVGYDELQKVYEARYVKLDATELRRLFQRKTPNKILMMFMHEEFELFTIAERPGVICMKLRAPRDELFAKFAEFEKAHEEFANRPKQNSYVHLPDRRRHGSKKASFDISVIRPILPQIQFDDDFTAEALFGQKSTPTPPADKFAYDDLVVGAGSKSVAPKKSTSTSADDNFNRLWNGAENFINGCGDDRSTDDERPAQELKKNPSKLEENTLKELKWTQRAKNGVFTSDEEEDEEEAPTPKNNSDKASAVNKHDLSAPTAKSTVFSVAACPPTRGDRPSSSRKFSITESDDGSECDDRIKSHRSISHHSKSVFSSSDEDEEKEKKGRNESVGDRHDLSPVARDVICPQSTRGTLSKLLPAKTSRIGSRNDDNDDYVFSPHAMSNEKIDNDEKFFERHAAISDIKDMSPSLSSQSRRQTVDSSSIRNRSMIPTNWQQTSNNCRNSAYSTSGSGLSSISRSLMAGRSDYELQSHMAMASFEFLKFKQGTHERVQYMSYFISTVVLYRSPEAIEYQTLIDIIDKLDPNYEMVLGGTSFLDFIETNCPNVAVLVHRDSVVFGWHLSKTGSSIAGRCVDDSDVGAFRASSLQ